MIDLDEKIAVIRAGLTGVTPGPWRATGNTTIRDRRGLVAKVGWRSAGETTQHIANCDPDTVRAILDARDAVTRERDEARAELAGRRMCVNCGRYAPAGHDRDGPLPECVGPEGLSACTFNLTPDEAWQHWRKKHHEARARIDELEKALRPFDELAVTREQDQLRAESERMREALTKVRSVLVRAFDRIHLLPRTTDTELSEEIGKALVCARAALDGGADG